MSRFLILLSLAATFPAAAQENKPLAPDLALVPADALVVGHIKIADLWKSDALKDARMIFAKAGADAVAAFDKRFVPVLSTVDRLTVYHPAASLEEGMPDLKVVGILSLTEPLDQEKVLKQFTGKVVKKKGKFADYVTDEEEYFAVRFVSPKLVVFGTAEGIQAMCDTKEVKADGPQRATLEKANTSPDAVVIGLSLESVSAKGRDELSRQLPSELKPLLAATSLSFSMDLDGDGHLHATATYGNAKDADAAEKAVNAASAMALELISDTRKTLTEKVLGDGKPGKIEDLPEAVVSLLGLGALQHAEDIVKSKPVKRRGDTLTLSQPLPPQFKTILGAGALAASVAAPAVGRLQVAANRMKSSNNLKQIALAMHGYHDTTNNFPPAAICDKKGKPLLSWRVAILPYIEQDNLYRQFKLDEPWDSEHNIKLSMTNVQTYMIPGLKNPKPGHTNYRVFVGNGAIFDWATGVGIAGITDGTSNTWLVVEGAESVPWAKPDDFEFDPKKELPKLGNFFHGFNVALADGSVRFYRKVPKMAKEWITRNGGEVITDEE